MSVEEVLRNAFYVSSHASLTTAYKETLAFPFYRQGNPPLKFWRFPSKVTELVGGKASIQTRFDWLENPHFELLHYPLSMSSETYLWLFLFSPTCPSHSGSLILAIFTSPKIGDWFLIRKVWSFAGESWDEANM